MDQVFLLLAYVVSIWIHYQVKEDDIWDDLDGQALVENIGSDNTTFMYAKRKALETIIGLFQTQQNSLGYAIQYLYKAWSLVETMYHLIEYVLIEFIWFLLV